MHYYLKIFLNKLFILLILSFIPGCSKIVEPIKIPDLKPDTKAQEQFSYDLLPLTFEEAQKLNLQPYPRLLSLPGNLFSATVIREDQIERNQFPPDSENFNYLLGVGDVVSFTQVIETSPTLISSSTPNNSLENQPVAVSASSSNVISTNGRIGSDGGLLLIGVGRLEAKGRPINDLRDEIRSVLIRNGKTPDFQLEIDEFNSQKAYITTDAPPDEKPDQIKYILPISDQGTSLRQILATAGIAFNETIFTVVKIQRNGKTYSLTLADLFSESAPEVFLKNKDHVFIQNLEFVKGKVFLVGGVTPQVLEIQPELRQTLAEMLFAAGGPLATPTAQRSAVYLLRGSSPVKAYHLDAQNPARILVADTVEMRPNDIVYVAEQPLSTFNRSLSTILPLRLLSRDTKAGAIP